MASVNPTILLPPRTPTPPLDEDGDLDRFANSPTKSFFDPTSLSPMDENFSAQRYSSRDGYATTTLPLSASDPNSLNSPMSVESNTSYGSTLLVEDSKGVFNFQPSLMPKAPVTKSVNTPHSEPHRINGINSPFSRTSAREEATNTNTAVSPINSSSSPNRALLSPFPTPFRSPPSRNVGNPCPKTS